MAAYGFQRAFLILIVRGVTYIAALNQTDSRVIRPIQCLLRNLGMILKKLFFLKINLQKASSSIGRVFVQHAQGSRFNP